MRCERRRRSRKLHDTADRWFANDEGGRHLREHLGREGRYLEWVSISLRVMKYITTTCEGGTSLVSIVIKQDTVIHGSHDKRRWRCDVSVKWQLHVSSKQLHETTSFFRIISILNLTLKIARIFCEETGLPKLAYNKLQELNKNLVSLRDKLF